MMETNVASRFIFFSDSLRNTCGEAKKADFESQDVRPRVFTHKVLMTRVLSDPEVNATMAVMRPQAAKEPRKGSQDGSSSGSGTGTAVITRTKAVTRKPGMYRVLLLNDDYTPMEFVVAVLKKYFQKSGEDANRIMLHVHHHGVGECGVFSYEVAETKVTQVMDYARKHQHPLQCIMEKK